MMQKARNRTQEGLLPLTHFPVAICTQTDADTEYTAASFMPSPSDYIKICTRRGKYVFIHRASTRRIAQRVSHLLTSHAARRTSQIDDDNNRKILNVCCKVDATNGGLEKDIRSVPGIPYIERKS
jgi:hypothetical protein